MISQCLNRRIDNIDELRQEVSAWHAHRDQLEAKVNWQFISYSSRLGLTQRPQHTEYPEYRHAAGPASIE